MRPRCPFPIGVTRSTTRIAISSAAGLEDEPPVRVQRRQVFENRRGCLLFRRVIIDHLDLHQSEILLPLDRKPDRPFDDKAGSQSQPANLTRGDVDVFRRGQVVVSGAPQEPVAVGQHFKCAAAANDRAAFDLVAHDRGNELAAIHARVLRHALLVRQSEELGHGQSVKVVQTARAGAWHGLRGFSWSAWRPLAGRVAGPVVTAGDGHDRTSGKIEKRVK